MEKEDATEKKDNHIPEHLRKHKKNLKSTQKIVFISFALNATTNLIVIGYINHLGGLSLVGTWALLNAVLMNLLVLDFGITNALTVRAVRDGVHATAPILKLLQTTALTAVALASSLAVILYITNTNIAFAILLTIASSLLQLVSGWLCALKMADHDHRWYYLQQTMRVALQSAPIFLAPYWVKNHPEILFSTSLLFGSALAYILCMVVTRKDLQNIKKGDLREIKNLCAGFGMENVAQRLYQPLSQYAVSNLLGPAALGSFTVALRIPMVVSQSISEALKTLVPAVAGAIHSNDKESIKKVLTNAVIAQVTLAWPPLIFFATHAPTIYLTWLGEQPIGAVEALRWMCFATILTSLAAPFYWTLQASGNIKTLSYIATGRLLFGLPLAALFASNGGGVVEFVTFYALGFSADAVLILIFAEKRTVGLISLASRIQLPALSSFVMYTFLLNHVIGATLYGTTTASTAIVLATLSNAIAVGIPALLALKHDVFTRKYQATQ